MNPRTLKLQLALVLSGIALGLAPTPGTRPADAMEITSRDVVRNCERLRREMGQCAASAEKARRYNSEKTRSWLGATNDLQRIEIRNDLLGAMARANETQRRAVAEGLASLYAVRTGMHYLLTRGAAELDPVAGCGTAPLRTNLRRARAILERDTQESASSLLGAMRLLEVEGRFLAAAQKTVRTEIRVQGAL